MFPVLFGDPAESLYGVYHRPAAPIAGPMGVVLCPPAFHEATHAHRALRSLADHCARAGLHTLRFDYRGTGDSAGGAEVCDLAGWTGDIGRALDELRASRGLAQVGLIGLRLGSTLALRAAAARGGLPFLVLWEPVEGADYLEELRDLQRRWVAFEVDQRPAARRRAGPDEVLGHPLPASLAADLAALSLEPGPGPVADRVLLVDEGAGDRVGVLGRRLESCGAAVEVRRVDAGRIWGRETDGEQVKVPRPVLAEIAGWITGTTPP